MYGIFTYMKTIKINHPWIGKYTVRPMDGIGDGIDRLVYHHRNHETWVFFPDIFSHHWLFRLAKIGGLELGAWPCFLIQKICVFIFLINFINP